MIRPQIYLKSWIMVILTYLLFTYAKSYVPTNWFYEYGIITGALMCYFLLFPRYAHVRLQKHEVEDKLEILKGGIKNIEYEYERTVDNLSKSVE